MQFDTDRPTIEEIRKLRKPRTETVWVPLDTSITERVEQLQRDLREAQRIDNREHRTPQAPRIQQELDAAIAEADRAAVGFTFQELPRRDYRALIEAHPDPSGSKRWDEDGFAPALIAACCVDPEMTLEDAEAIWSEWGESTTWALFSTAWKVNEGKVEVPFFGGSTNGTRGSPPNSTSVSETDELSDTTNS